MMKTMKLSDIKVPYTFGASTPNVEKVAKHKKYFEENGHTMHKLLIDENNFLLDGYIDYLLLMGTDLQEVDVNTNIHGYVYGKHIGQLSNKEYVWELPYNAKSAPNVGTHAIANTRRGNVPIVVTKVEYTSRKPHNGTIRRIVKWGNIYE